MENQQPAWMLDSRNCVEPTRVDRLLDRGVELPGVYPGILMTTGSFGLPKPVEGLTHIEMTYLNQELSFPNKGYRIELLPIQRALDLFNQDHPSMSLLRRKRESYGRELIHVSVKGSNVGIVEEPTVIVNEDGMLEYSSKPDKTVSRYNIGNPGRFLHESGVLREDFGPHGTGSHFPWDNDAMLYKSFDGKSLSVIRTRSEPRMPRIKDKTVPIVRIVEI